MNLPVGFDPSLLITPPSPRIATPDGQADQRRIEKAVEDFEAVLLTILIRQMRKAIPNSHLLDGEDKAGEAYREMMDATLAQHMATSRAFGLARSICDRLIAQQRARHAEDAPNTSFLDGSYDDNATS